MATSETTKPGQSSDEDYIQSRRDEFVRHGLLIWASLRLAVSVYWTSVFVRLTWLCFRSDWYQGKLAFHTAVPTHLMFRVVTIALQLVEFGMIVTFICAGVKKSASLYRAYYRYCILTLIIYIIAVILCSALSSEIEAYIGEIYLTYHINDYRMINNDHLVFGVAAILDICLEILLIRLIKRLINKYSYEEDVANYVNV